MRHVPRILRALQGSRRFYSVCPPSWVTPDEAYAQKALDLADPLAEPAKSLALAARALEANALTTATYLYTIPGLDAPIHDLRTLIALLSIYHPQRTPSRLALLEGLLGSKDLVLTSSEKSRLLLVAVQYTMAEARRALVLRQAVQFVLGLPGDPPEISALAGVIEFACKNAEFAISRMCAETIMGMPLQRHPMDNCLALALALCSKRRTEHTFARRLFAYMRPSFDAPGTSARLRRSLIWASVHLNDKEASTEFLQSVLQSDRLDASALLGSAYVAANYFELQKHASEIKARLDELQVKFSDRETIALVKHTGQKSLQRALDLASLLPGSAAPSAYLALASIAAREHKAAEFRSIVQILEKSPQIGPFEMVMVMLNWFRFQEPFPGMHDTALELYQKTLWAMSPSEAQSSRNVRHRRSAIEMLASLYSRDPDCDLRSEISAELISQAVKVGLPPSRVSTLCRAKCS